jgi:hypothetical protein
MRTRCPRAFNSVPSAMNGCTSPALVSIEFANADAIGWMRTSTSDNLYHYVQRAGFRAAVASQRPLIVRYETIGWRFGQGEYILGVEGHIDAGIICKMRPLERGQRLSLVDIVIPFPAAEVLKFVPTSPRRKASSLRAPDFDLSSAAIL